MIVKDRKEADHWLEITHTGENEGAGVVRWGSDENSRFRARSGKTEIQTQALDLLERRGYLSVQDRRKVKASSLRRILNTPAIREKLGVEFESGELGLLADEKRVANALLYVVKRLISGETKTKDIYTKEDRAAYAEHLPREVVVTLTKSPGTGVIQKAKTISTAKPIARTKSKPRDNLIPGDCILKVDNTRIRYIELELRTLSLESYSNAVSVLFRVFLELSADAYIAKKQLAANDVLSKKLTAVLTDLLTQKKLTREQATPVRRACQRDSLLAPSVTLMHQYVHNQHVFPGQSDLRAHWDNLQPFMTAIWSP